MKLFKFPIFISILLHFVLLVSIAWIKIGNEYDMKAKLPVTLVEKKQDKLLKRSIPTRSIPSLNNPIKQYIPETSANIRPINSPSYLVYNQAVSTNYIANIQDIKYNLNPVEKMRYLPDGITSRPITVQLRQTAPKPTYIKIDNTGGNKFIDDNLSVLAKPDAKFHQNDNNSLKRYIDIIRKKIEANKRYPLSAMNSGIEGRLEVMLTILNNGQLDSVRIINSSGNEVLDNSALESVRNSAPFPPIPKDIGREKITISFFLVFKLSQLGR